MRKYTKKDYVLIILAQIAFLYFIFIYEGEETEVDKVDYTAKAEAIYQTIKPHDSKLRNVSITDNTMVLYRAIASEIGQDEQAKSWCLDFKEFKYIQIRSAVNNDFLGGVMCN